MNINEKVKEISKALLTLKKYNLNNPPATNLPEEKAKFFSQKNYSPILQFKENSNPPNNLVEVTNVIKSHKLPNDLETYFLEIVEHINLNHKVSKLIGTDSFAEEQFKYFGWDIDSVNIDKLSELLKSLPQEDNSKLLKAEEIKFKFDEYIRQYIEFDNWNVEVTDNSREGIFVLGDSQKIVISTVAIRSEIEVDRLITHEIKSHGFRNINNRKLDLEFIRDGYSKGLEIYTEGQAVYNEIAAKKITKKSLEKYMHRLETAQSRQATFLELYNKSIERNYSEAAAFEFAYRFKRGISDTSSPGINIKDSAYLYGYSKVCELSSELLRFLYVGKVSARDYLLKELGLIDDSNIFIPEL